ncbi:phage regulatory protein/antirepressor Ant [Candidatus Sororendozoicomonas aggregata]|uniref:phage regulatory protein/antirepressor Ant n=1 Tax=Candidatus Sororendozoicomonas aggregata TaxID=3073239 RepID=UPI002ED12B63
MSSREIAALTGKQHKHVKRDIESMFKTLEINPSTFGRIYTDQRNREQTEFLLPRRECEILVTGYDVKRRSAVIDRWMALELASRRNTPVIPQTYAAALLEAGRLAQLAEERQRRLDEQSPKVRFVEKYCATNGSKTFRQVAKLLCIKEPEFRKFLADNKIMYRLNDGWAAYQCHITAGRFEVVAGVSGNKYNYTAHRFTAKGIEYVADKMAAKALGKQ